MMKRIFVWVPAALFVFNLLLVAGCSEDSECTGPNCCKGGVCSSDSNKTLDGSTSDSSGPTSDSPPYANVCGSLETEAKVPVASVDVIVCDDSTCINGKSDTAGAFCVEVFDPGDYAVHTAEAKTGGKHFAEVYLPVTLTETDISSRAKIDLGTLVLPEVGNTVELNPEKGGVLDWKNGVKLTIPANVTTLSGADADDIAMAKVEKNNVHPRLLATQAGDPVAIYVFVPAKTTFTSSISYELPADSLDNGTELKVFVPSPSNGKLVASGEASVSSGKITGSGITALGWVLFYIE